MTAPTVRVTLPKCACCPNVSLFLLTVDCPRPHGEDKTCWLCDGTGHVRVCAECFYLGPDRDGVYGGGDA